MGIYAEYLDKKFNFDQLAAERKAQLKRISQLRGDGDVLVFAADLKNTRQPIGINYSDLLPFNHQLSNLSGTAIDIILETPGGSGETVEDMGESPTNCGITANGRPMVVRSRSKISAQ